MGEIIKCRKGDIADKIWRIVLLCAVMVLLMISNKQIGENIFSSLLDIVCPKIEVQAATKDANGHTVATDLSGQAYAVFCEDNTTLYLLRDNTTGRAIGSSYTVTDTDGSTHSGVVTQNDLESTSGEANIGGEYKNNDSFLVNKNNTIAKEITGVKCIGDIRPAQMNYWFAGFTSAISMNISSIDTSKTLRMINTFFNCSSLVSIDVSSFDTSNVEYMNAMFEGCSSLTSLDLSNFDTSHVMYFDAMFAGCRSMTNLNISNFNTGFCWSMEKNVLLLFFFSNH